MYLTAVFQKLVVMEGTWKSDPAVLTDAFKEKEVPLESVTEGLNAGRRWCLEKVRIKHGCPCRIVKVCF